MNRREFLKKSLGGIIVGSIPLISGCGIKDPVSYDIDKPGFNIHLLKDENITFYDIIQKTVLYPEINPEPWISSDDIEMYDFSTHLLYLKKDLIFPEKISYKSKPFVAFADGKQCYTGCIQSSASSLLICNYPFIRYPLLLDFYPGDLHYISFIHCYDNDKEPPEDLRNNQKIINALISTGKFHAGLSCNLDSVVVYNYNNSASVEFTYTVLNNDTDNLYVLDPDKTGAGLFHYYTNGVYIDSISSTCEQTERPEPYDLWLSDWLTKVESGNTITRTVKFDDYPKIPPGTYTCSFGFPSHMISHKGKINPNDGRVWFRSISSSTYILKISE